MFARLTAWRTSSRGRPGQWMKLIAPELVDKIAASAVREKSAG
ncbi:MAG TPA: hypothetical protein VNQ79_26005 [Blastocatellia bacterium]|nr:hypothetical protein [Blastocatellia bacterium]